MARQVTDLRTHLAALVAGTAESNLAAPPGEALDVGAAIAACAEASLDMRPPEPALPPSSLLPILP